MAIAPITSVSFKNNYGNVTFQRKNKDEHMSSNPVKKLAVPAAALVLAMTPSNASAKYDMDVEPDKTEMNAAQADSTIVAYSNPYTNVTPNSDNITAQIFYISTDGDNNTAQAAKIAFYEKKKVRYLAKDSEGKYILDSEGRYIAKYKEHNYTNMIRVDAIKIENVTGIVEGTGDKVYYKKYSVIGPESQHFEFFDDSKLVRKGKSRHTDNSYEISESFYNELKGIFGKEVKYIETNKEEIYKDEDAINGVYGLIHTIVH